VRFSNESTIVAEREQERTIVAEIVKVVRFSEESTIVEANLCQKNQNVLNFIKAVKLVLN
jgi:hypothetical protein